MWPCLLIGQKGLPDCLIPSRSRHVICRRPQQACPFHAPSPRTWKEGNSGTLRTCSRRFRPWERAVIFFWILHYSSSSSSSWFALSTCLKAGGIAIAQTSCRTAYWIFFIAFRGDEGGGLSCSSTLAINFLVHSPLRFGFWSTLGFGGVWTLERWSS